VDRSCQQWSVREPEGNFWSVPAFENPWEHRRPFHPRSETDLAPVPGHYRNMLGVPF
jgi:hypothetical protein